MTFMPWSAALSVGMAEIDEQHCWLVNTLNQLHDELAAHEPDCAMIGQVLEGLVDYTVNHFVAEEVLFQRYAYPQASAHKAMHDLFTHRIMSMLTAHEGGKNLGGEVLELLKEWLVQHIMGADKSYVPYLSAAQEAERLIASVRQHTLRSPKAVVRLIYRADRRRRSRRAGR